LQKTVYNTTKQKNESISGIIAGIDENGKPPPATTELENHKP